MTETQDAAFASDEAAASSARPDDEMLPFLNNFHDIFTTIGVVILFAGLSLGGVQLHDAMRLDMGSLSSHAAAIALIALIAVVAWALSSLLVGRQRRILPGIVLSCVFVGLASVALSWVYIRLILEQFDSAAFDAAVDSITSTSVLSREAFDVMLADLPWTIRLMPVVFGGAALVVSMLYYASFRLPFAGGLTGLILVTFAMLVWLVIDPYTVVRFNPILNLLMGLALFVGGIVFDARDPARTTRLSGTGFWLHFFAAPMLLSAAVTLAISGATVDGTARMTSGPVFLPMTEDGYALRAAIVSLIVIAVFALISLLINRRALIVSGLLTTGVALAVLVKELGLDGAGVAAVTLLVLGGIVVLLGVAWTPVRSVLTAPFPSSGVIARIIPPVSHGHEG
ncbi:hypothetical protein ACFELO_07540 [Oceanicaulis sp. LC35]|uniref:hypothetical protein n=1 Tax=Oceanicaulis sp. LC35 TaxID=3349635 RepID=UPI003F878924